MTLRIADDTDSIQRRLAELRGEHAVPVVTDLGPTMRPVADRMPEDDWATLKASVRVDPDRPRAIRARVLP
jgi:hypothetical protein